MAQDAVALIKADHRTVEQLFREFEEAGDRAYKTKQRLVAEIIKELEVHATIEEETYYPAVEAKAKNPVAPQYVHADMFNTNLVYAHMGNHYADSTAPEFNGGTFTNTFILGTFDGRITFYEPMMSKDYLDSKPDDCLPVKQPAAVQTDGW